jgi:hypothetical protein
MLTVSTSSVGLVVLIFGFFAPWYRSWAGATLFGVKVSLFLILLILAMNEKRIAPEIANILTIVVFPCTTITSIALLAVMIKVQIGRVNSPMDEAMFSKEPTPHMWDGKERRESRMTEEEKSDDGSSV